MAEDGDNSLDYALKQDLSPQAYSDDDALQYAKNLGDKVSSNSSDSDDDALAYAKKLASKPTQQDLKNQPSSEAQAIQDLSKGAAHGLMAFPNAVESGVNSLLSSAGIEDADYASSIQKNRLSNFSQNANLPMKIGNAAGEAVSSAPAAVLGGEVVGAGIGATTRFLPELAQTAAENPLLAKYAGSGAIGAGSGAAGSESVGGNPVKGALIGGVVGAGVPAIADLVGAKPSTPSIDSDSLKAIAQQKYAEADALGGSKPEAMNSLIGKVDSLMPQTELQKTVGDPVIEKESEFLNKFKDKPLSFNDATFLDKRYSDLIDQHINPNTREVDATGKKLQDIQQHLRELMQDPANSIAAPGTDGFAKYREAQQTWAAHLKLKDVERINDNADLANDPAKALQSGYRQLAKKASNGRTGWTDDEIQALRNSAKNGKSTALLNLLGSRLNPIAAGAAGGPIAAAGAYVGSSLARSMATRIEAGKANDIINLIAQRPGVRNAFTQTGNPSAVPGYVNHLISSSGAAVAPMTTQ